MTGRTSNSLEPTFIYQNRNLNPLEPLQKYQNSNSTGQNLEKPNFKPIWTHLNPKLWAAELTNWVRLTTIYYSLIWKKIMLVSSKSFAFIFRFIKICLFVWMLTQKVKLWIFSLVSLMKKYHKQNNFSHLFHSLYLSKSNAGTLSLDWLKNRNKVKNNIFKNAFLYKCRQTSSNTQKNRKFKSAAENEFRRWCVKTRVQITYMVQQYWRLSRRSKDFCGLATTKIQPQGQFLKIRQNGYWRPGLVGEFFVHHFWLLANLKKYSLI